MRYAMSVALAVALFAAASAQPARADAGISFGFFYSNLSPHGAWLVSAQYGRVWQPHVYTRAWNPYYDGRWVYTDVGWTWASDYAWGAIPYHYGTWALDPRLGWVWVPGYVWAPAWVTFVSGPDYIGWAPTPVDFSIGAPFRVRVAQAPLYVVVPARHFLTPRVGSHAYPVERARVLLTNARVADSLALHGDVVVNHGVDPSFVRRATGRALRPMPVERVSRVAPFAQVTRAKLRVDPARITGSLRVAERISPSQPLPTLRREETRPEKGRPAPEPRVKQGAKHVTPPGTQQPARKQGAQAAPEPKREQGKQKGKGKQPGRKVP